MTSIWCLTISISHPDWKRPSASFKVEHFKTEMDAKKAKRKLLTKFYYDYEIPVECRKDEDKLHAYWYSSSYMDMPPIEIVIYKVDLQ